MLTYLLLIVIIPQDSSSLISIRNNASNNDRVLNVEKLKETLEVRTGDRSLVLTSFLFSFLFRFFLVFFFSDIHETVLRTPKYSNPE